MLPCGSQPTSVGRQKMYFCAGGFGPVRVATAPPTAGGLRPSTISTLPFGAELGDHVRAFVDRPDIVLRIDAHRVGELEAVIALADFLEEIAVLVEFPQPRGRRAAVIDEDVALRIGRDRNRFAQNIRPAAASGNSAPL